MIILIDILLWLLGSCLLAESAFVWFNVMAVDEDPSEKRGHSSDNER